MSISTHIDKWINRSFPDYYVMFIKTWIPYNAWYMHNYYNEAEGRTTDKAIISYIKNNNNVYKSKIISLITGNDQNSLKFKKYICELHYALEAHPIPNYDDRISFNNICIDDNNNRSKIQIVSKYTIKANHDTALPRKDPRWIFEVILNKTSVTKYRIALKKCSMTELHQHQDFINISNDLVKRGVENCLKEIDPNKKISVVVNPKTIKSGYKAPNNSILIDKEKHLYFRDNTEDVSKTIVQIIYELRCKLFHGEIEPTNANMEIFEYAFYIQQMLIKELQ